MSTDELKAAARAKAQQVREAVQAKKVARANPKLVNMPDPTGDAELDSLADLDEMKRGFRERAKLESSRFMNVTDSEYWFAVCFQTREQKERFLQAMNWIQFGDKYLPGGEIAKLHGIDLPEANFGKTEPKVDKEYAGLAL
ncbi:hypothetical protein V8Z80_08465 [Orrella sp. JC864]|uniref:hypothetical protein n=1 Tax=Orrella sp. JC864 TaxID=3120298 RepID=UPI00300BB47E